MLTIKLKPLIVSLLIPIAVGGFSAFLTMKGMQEYQLMQQPSLSPPPIVFAIVWPILYILMGVSSYLVYTSKTAGNKKTAYSLYALQLAVNFFWSIIFFNLKMYGFSTIWILLLIALVIGMIINFLKFSSAGGYLQIPYLLWLCFATYLNFMVYMLN